MVIAGIGSRETPDEILAEMNLIGLWCREHKVWVRSGHADGADYAFEQGAGTYAIPYMPWHDFNSKLKVYGSAHYPWDMGPELRDWMNEMTDKYHPAPKKLSDGARRLMGRNACQVFGSRPLEIARWSQAVVCWTSDGEASGGTGQAIRMAIDAKIPVLNMQRSEWNDHLKVQDQLRRILGL